MISSLFEAIDDGFCIIQFIDGPHGPLSDYVHIEANSGYERHTGIAGIVGKRLREIEPDNADAWIRIYGRVLSTGETVRFEQEFVAVGRHIEVSATRVGRMEMGQVSVLFVTGYAENAVLNHGHLERGMQVLTKPFSADALARRVRDLVGGDDPAA